ncbi:unnamed protein product [Camellia sinensis]
MQLSMEFHLLPILAFLSLTLVASHATPSPEAYWNSVLPNSPIPKAVKDLLHPGFDIRLVKPLERKKMFDGKGKPVYGGVSRAIQSNYDFSATADQLHYNPNIVIFFLENDLKKYTKMTLRFTRITTSTIFLPRQVAEKIPFSSKKMPQILDYFSVNPTPWKPRQSSKQSKNAKSLELGKSIQAISTEVKKETPLQTYTIEGVKKMASDAAVVCHRQDYAYTVFLCHTTQTTIKAYKVSMVGVNGTKAEAVAVCHTNTSHWNPKHLAFQVLKVKVKPGTVPICHFLPEDHIVWVHN